MGASPGEDPLSRRAVRSLWRTVIAGTAAGAIAGWGAAEFGHAESLLIASTYVGAIGGAALAGLMWRLRRRSRTPFKTKQRR
jgi:high-affinity Fe2+/Pb2+ permease